MADDFLSRAYQLALGVLVSAVGWLTHRHVSRVDTLEENIQTIKETISLLRERIVLLENAKHIKIRSSD